MKLKKYFLAFNNYLKIKTREGKSPGCGEEIRFF
jgi:hypothetical protein